MDATLERLIAHNVWAHKLYAEHLAKQDAPDPFALKMLSHNANAEDVWFGRIAGITGVKYDVWRVLSAPELVQVFLGSPERYQKAQQEGLARKIQYTRPNGETLISTVADILTHLCVHAAHHRGQIAVHSSRLGTPMPYVDFIAYCRTAGV